MSVSANYLIIIQIVAIAANMLPVRIDADTSGLERMPGLYGEDCASVVVQTMAGEKESVIWTLISKPGGKKVCSFDQPNPCPAYKIAANHHCSDPCAYQDKSGKYKGVYCLPRNEEDGSKCCAISHGTPTGMACPDKMRQFGLGDRPMEGCPWGYEEDKTLMGPTNWDKWFPDCAGENQSPINIELEKVEFTDAGAITFVGYDLPIKGELYDNGHSLHFADEPEDAPHTISGGPFADSVSYHLAQVHWHWGETNDNGTEHSVDGVKYAMTVHMVHYNSKYENIDEAFKNPDGAAVITFFYKISETKNPGLDELMKSIVKATENGVNYKIHPKERIKFEDFFPIDMDHKYFYYNGSFTTPPCTEEVFWIIFNETETISQDQLDTFRKLKNFEGNPLAGNYRQTQPLNGRKVLGSSYFK